MTKPTIKTMAIWLIITIVLALVIIFIYNHTESYTVKKTLAQPYEVKQNPYLALEHYLNKQQQKITTIQHIDQIKKLPSQQQNLLLLGSRAKLTKQQNQSILTWVSQGGHLIVEARQGKSIDSKTKTADPLLNPLGIKLVRATSTYPKSTTKLYLEGQQQPITLEMDNCVSLIDQQDRATQWASNGNDGDNDDIKLLQLPYGKGKITVLTSATLWNNNTIAKHDHAWLLLYLTAGHDTSILYTPISYTRDKPSFITALIKNYPYTLAIFILLIALILWHTGIRQGPVEPISEKNRRQLTLQLNAQANFIYNQIGAQQLITLLQQEINYLIKKRLPQFDKLPTQQKHELLSKLTKQPLDLINQLMQATPDKKTYSQAEFTQTIIALQAIRNAL